MKYKTGDKVQLVDIDKYKGYRFHLVNEDFSEDRVVILKGVTPLKNWRIVGNCWIVPEHLISHKIDADLMTPEEFDQNRAEMWGFLKLAEIALAEGIDNE